MTLARERCEVRRVRPAARRGVGKRAGRGAQPTFSSCWFSLRMPYFFCRLNPPRPSFALDMTDAEQRLIRSEPGFGYGVFPMANAVTAA